MESINICVLIRLLKNQKPFQMVQFERNGHLIVRVCLGGGLKIFSGTVEAGFLEFELSDETIDSPGCG